MLESHRTVAEWIESNRNDHHLHAVAEDLSEEIDWLLGPDFVWRAGYDRFRGYGRYFQAMEERLKRLQSLPQIKDDERVISKKDENDITSSYLNGGIITKNEIGAIQTNAFGDISKDKQLTNGDKEIVYVKQENDILPVNNKCLQFMN